jgi:hypothetical protein
LCASSVAIKRPANEKNPKTVADIMADINGQKVANRTATGDTICESRRVGHPEMTPMTNNGNENGSIDQARQPLDSN